MFGTLFALLALTVFVLPGFVASRVARGRRATPATIGDLPLALVALGYALVIHGTLAATGWTASLFRKVEPRDAWENHVPALLLWAVAVFAAAILLGLVLHWTFERLASGTQPTGWRAHVFHTLGGEDVRDGFDYVFGRRRRQGTDFIVLVERDGPNGPEKRAGRYGDQSYFGQSPRPHDLYLEELWTLDEEDNLKLTEPAEGGWFAATTIRDVQFRELPKTELTSGTTTRLASFGIADAIRAGRHREARLIAERVPEVLSTRPSTGELAIEFRAAAQRVTEAIAAAEDDGEAMERSELYDAWRNIRGQLFDFGVVATAFVRRDDLVGRPEHLAALADTGRRDVRVAMRDGALWSVVFKHQVNKVSDAMPNRRAFAFDGLIALVVDGLFDIDNFEWDSEDEAWTA